MDLLPSILELVGERAGDVSEAGWVLTSVDGAPVALDKSLDASDIRDGSVLRLRSGLELVDPPLYDDVVDAIAETVQKKVDRRDPVRIIATAVVVAALAGSALLLSQAGGLAAAAAAAVACALCLTISAQAARVARMHHVAVAFASAGVGLGFVAGESLITGAWTWPRMLLGVSVALVAAVVGRLATGVDSAVFTAWHTALTLWTLGCVAGVIWQDTPVQVGTVVAIVAVAIVSITPWLSVRFSRLPIPLVPDSAEDLQKYDPRAEIAEAPVRTERGVNYLHGLTIGSIVAALVGLTCSTTSSSWWALWFSLAVLVALMLRTRFIPDAVARCTTAGVLLCGAGVAFFVLSRNADTPVLWGLAGVLGLGGLLGALATATSKGRRITPVTARLIDVAEGLSAVAVLPLGLAVIGLYGYVRGL